MLKRLFVDLMMIITVADGSFQNPPSGESFGKKVPVEVGKTRL
jgi:hypothetical protein